MAGVNVLSIIAKATFGGPETSDEGYLKRRTKLMSLMME
jgi:hypothetical protein